MNSTLAVLATLDGLAYAALVFLVSVGLSLIFGVLRIVNVAHGSFYAFGAFLAATLSLLVTPISPWLTYPALLVAALTIGIVAGGLVERVLLSRVYGREEVLQLLIADVIAHRLSRQQHLHGHGPSVAVGSGDQLLADDRVQA